MIHIENRPVSRVAISGDEPLSEDLAARVAEALDQAEDWGPGAVIVVHIAGSMSPNALRAWPGPANIVKITKWERVLRRMERAHSTTIALVEHACSALALELLLVADRRLASSNFSFQLAMPGRNVWPSMAIYRLARQIGEAEARRLLLDGSHISVERAMELKIVDKIVASAGNGSCTSSDLLEYAPAEGFPVRRRLIQDCLCTSFDDALGLHLAACERALRHESSVCE